MGLVAIAGFASVYVRVSQTHGRIPSLLAATATYIAVSAVLMKLPFLSAVWAFAFACGALLLTMFSFPRRSSLKLEVKPSGLREISMRMAMAAILVFL